MNLTTNPGSSSTDAAAAEKRPSLSVIIVTWNVADLLSDCLNSLDFEDVHEHMEVLVVDNASSDNTAAMVRASFPWVRLTVNHENLGFSRANNQAIALASGTFVLLLNPDTIVHRHAISKLIVAATLCPEAGILGPKHYTANGVIHYECASDFPTVWNVFCDLSLLSRAFPRSRLFNGRLLGHWDHLDDREVPAVPGTAMLIRREVIAQIGALDESMFYAEDMDYCMRAHKAGWRVRYVAAAAIVHLGGGSSKRSGNLGLNRKIAFQSFWLFTWKHHGPLTAAALSSMVLFWSLGAVALSSVIAAITSSQSPLADTMRTWRHLAQNLLQWSISRKKHFRHHLASAPQF